MSTMLTTKSEWAGSIAVWHFETDVGQKMTVMVGGNVRSTTYIRVGTKDIKFTAACDENGLLDPDMGCHADTFDPRDQRIAKGKVKRKAYHIARKHAIMSGFPEPKFTPERGQS